MIPRLGWVASGNGDFAIGSTLIEVKHTERNLGAKLKIASHLIQGERCMVALAIDIRKLDFEELDAVLGAEFCCE